MNNDKLTTLHANINIVYQQNDLEYNNRWKLNTVFRNSCCIVGPGCEQIKIPVTLTNGTGIFPHTKFQNGLETSNNISLIRLNAIENESPINNPGDVDQSVSKMIKDTAENPIGTYSMPQNKDQIRVISVRRIMPVTFQSKNTPHSNINTTTKA